MEAQKQQYLNFIVKSLHIELNDFMQCVAATDRCYEPLIYRWVISLFDKGVPKQRALHIIQRARMRILIQNNTWMHSQIKAQQLESIENMLKNNTYYKKLSDEQKAIAIQKIASLADTSDISVDSINKILETMNPLIEVKTEENRMIIFRNTLQRIKKEIFKLINNQ